jgi:hypothetical protein
MLVWLGIGEGGLYQKSCWRWPLAASETIQDVSCAILNFDCRDFAFAARVVALP